MGEAILPKQPGVNKNLSADVRDNVQPQVSIPDIGKIADSQPAKPASIAGSGPSRNQRIAMAVGAGAVGVAGVGLTAIGITMDGSDSTSSAPHTQDQRLPLSSEFNFIGVAESRVNLNPSNTAPISAQEMKRFNKNRNLNQNALLFAVPFNVEGNNVVVEKVTAPDAITGERVGSIFSFSGIKEGTQIVAPISGEVNVSELTLNGVVQAKTFTISHVTPDGKTIITQIFAPVDVSVIPASSNGQVSVTEGSPLFTYNQTTKLPGSLGQSLEIHFAKGNTGDDASIRAQETSLMSSNGKTLYLK